MPRGMPVVQGADRRWHAGRILELALYEDISVIEATQRVVRDPVAADGSLAAARETLLGTF